MPVGSIGLPWLPRDHPQVEVLQSAPVTKGSTMDAAKTVLVVEDDVSMREAINRALAVAGIATALYASAEALLAVDHIEGDVCVVSDHILPAMSGLELLAVLRKRGFTGPLILITAHDTPEVRKMAERSGVAAYLVKPFLGSTLVAAIRAAFAPTNPE
jgi:FixJ family two-component response regulator